MTGDHESAEANRLSTVLAAMAAVDRELPVLDRLCTEAAGLLSMRGAGISLMVDGELRGTAGASDPGAVVVQELQFQLGEGPCLDAWASMEPVLEPDLNAPARVRWPAFGTAGVQSGIRAVFAFPLGIGAIRIGVLVLYRDWPGG